MAIRYILGRAGKGKSFLIYREITKALQDGGDQPLILLVPEQYTLQAERDVIDQLCLPGIIRLEVTSFTRLAQNVFSRVGGLTRVFLNEQGKNMVLKYIVDECSSQLNLYQKAIHHEGFIRHLSQIIKDFKQHNICPDDMKPEEGFALINDQIVRQKLKDINIIYQRFNQYMEGRYIDSEDFMSLLMEKIEDYKPLKKARVWVDGFNTFSPLSLRIIEKIMLNAHDTTISFTLDPHQSKTEQDLFQLTERSYRQIRDVAKNNALREEVIFVDSSSAEALKSSEINHLEAEFYAYPGKEFVGVPQNIELFAAANINDEIEALAAALFRSARQGYRWKDMAVICHDMERYGTQIRRTFREYAIPCFMDKKRDVMSHPLTRFLLSVLEIISRGFRYEDVFNYLKSGFSNLSKDEIEVLENYALEYGIKGAKWRNDFTYGDAEKLSELNRLRILFYKPIEGLEGMLKGSNTVKEMTQSIFSFLESESIYVELEKWTNSLTDRGFLEEANESSQLWNAVIDILEQMLKIMGEQEVGLKEYIRILKAGFSSLEIKIIPTTIDQVLLGDIQRTKSHDIKCLYVIGVNDGVLPSLGPKEGLLSETELEVLRKKGLDLGYEPEKNQIEEHFLIYTALAKSMDKICFSYALADEEGRALRPSILLDQLKMIFPCLPLNTNLTKDKQWQLKMIATPESSFKHLVEKLRLGLDGKEIEGFWWDLYRWYFEQDAWQNYRKILVHGLFHRNQPASIDPRVTQRLFGTPLRSSVSRLEQYARCPFAHFLRYGIRPLERKSYEIDSLDLGMLFHDSLLRFSRRLRDDKRQWPELEKEECDAIVDTVVDEVARDFGRGIFNSDPRYQSLLKRLKRISRRAVWLLTQHIRRGDFRPWDYEVAFGRGEILPALEIGLENGEKVILEGRIDRVDLLEFEDSYYVRILDYKSGRQEFNLSEVFHGLSLQLVVYLKVLLTAWGQMGDKPVLPAGIFYFKIDDPMINSEAKMVEVVEKEIAKRLKLKGLALADARIIRQMDHEIAGYSTILPLGLSAQDEFYRFSSVLPPKELSALLKHVKRLLEQIAREMLNGHIRIEPVYNRKRLACDYCSFSTICQFDRQFPDNDWRCVKPLTHGEVLEYLAKENDN